jgi:hypothetical protein
MVGITLKTLVGFALIAMDYTEQGKTHATKMDKIPP